ncbi:Cytochrome P450 [Penicillium cf. griseofulvum]|uniref:Cytochrome P450 n=1 Tax=Penicillium cf. griseofulvum TaxID=2972120 RepID=A0A9W9N0Z7_9EURO|nr:Cytochrome P450 [Penicillium cf. griseofulvum]KAJ5422444.1 Cytochrome P450 [Penicillium cf. griseofulvum]
MTGGYHIIPAEGIQVDEVYIPGDVNVFVPMQLIQTDERYHTDAKQFVPERWTERREMCSEGAPFFPFVLDKYCPTQDSQLTL